MSMIDDIRARMEESPFQPFALRTADGREHLVPTVDHIYLPLGEKRVFVTNDEGVTVGLTPLLIVGIVFDLPSAPQPG